MIGEWEQTYCVRKLANSYEIASFEESKESLGVYQIRSYNGRLNCNCPGFRRQKNPDEHKHCKMVQKFIDMNEEPGFIYWMDGDNVECLRFIDFRIWDNAELD